MQTIKKDGKEYPIRYMHIRLHNDKDEVLSKGGKTVAYIGEFQEVPEIKDYIPKHKRLIEIERGVANCSRRDVYNKKLGRLIATGRLLKKLGLPRK